jgi:hypothetical protein
VSETPTKNVTAAMSMLRERGLRECTTSQNAGSFRLLPSYLKIKES